MDFPLRQGSPGQGRGVPAQDCARPLAAGVPRALACGRGIPRAPPLPSQRSPVPTWRRRTWPRQRRGSLPEADSLAIVLAMRVLPHFLHRQNFPARESSWPATSHRQLARPPGLPGRRPGVRGNHRSGEEVNAPLGYKPNAFQPNYRSWLSKTIRAYVRAQ